MEWAAAKNAPHPERAKRHPYFITVTTVTWRERIKYFQPRVVP
jgi:hypothetical protein